jgi:hypothetical protein
VKIGSENRNKVIAAGVLMVLALFSVGRMLFSSPDRPPVSAVQAAANAPTARPATAAKKVAAKGQEKAGSESLDPRLQLKLLEASEAVKYEGKGRNIFLAQAEVIPQPKAQVAVKQPVMPPPPPQPPPIDLRFFGFASRPGEPKRVFLKQGEDTFIAGEGDIVDRRYRIIRIGPTFVEVEDVLNNNRQSIPLTQG